MANREVTVGCINVISYFLTKKLQITQSVFGKNCCIVWYIHSNVF